jgi:hypothetical protein
MANTPQDDINARIVALMEEQARLEAANAEREREIQIGNEAFKQAELRAQMSIDEVEVREKLKRFDVDKKGIGASILGNIKKELDFTKDMHSMTSAINKDQMLRSELETKIQEQSALGNTTAAQHLQTLLEQHNVSAGINTNMLASAGSISMFGAKGAAIGKMLGSTAFGIAQMIGNAFFSVLGVVWDMVKSVLGFMWNRLKEIFNVFMDIQKVVDNLSADVGLTVQQTAQLWTNVVGIGQAALTFGVTFEEAIGLMRTFSELTGLNRVFLAEQITELSAVAKATGLGVAETGKMYATMELIGMSTQTFHGYVDGVRKSAGALNLNVTNVLKTVEKLMPQFRGLNFKNGIQDLTKIVEKAQAVRFSLDNMQNLANQVFNPEGAIELSAKLRVLGGSFAQMADPFNLMLKGQTDAAGLMDDMIKSLSGMAIKNKDGFFSIPPVQQAIIREVAAATGESAENMTQAAIQMAKQTDIINKLSPSIVNPEDRKLIANLAEMRDGKYVVKVGSQGILTAVDSLTSSQIEGIRSQQQNEVIAARNRMDIIQKFQNIYQMFLMALTPMFKRISDIIEKPNGIMQSLIVKAGEFAKFLGDKLEVLFANGGIEKLFGNIQQLITDLLGVLTGDQNITDKIIDTLTTVISGVLTKIMPAIGKVIADSGAGEAVKGTAGLMGALGGAGTGVMAGAAIGSLFGGIGAIPGSVIGGIIGLLGGGTGGYFGGRALAGSMIPDAPVKDAIIRSDGSVQPFSSGDLAMLINESSIHKAAMIPSQSMLTQAKTYNKESFMPLNAYGGGGGNNTPQNITLNLSGVLEVKGDGGTAYLTSADLKNIGLQHLTHLILNETDRYRNHQSGKKLPNEIITPIRST